MNKKEEFKVFARKHPELIEHVKNNTMSWQKFYEIYDIYGEEDDVWKTYLTSSTSEASGGLLDFASKLKNIDTNTLQEHIANAQKALGVLSELTSSKSAGASTVSPKVPRPINHFFED
ncbi:MAG: YlbD family protein [Bacilli bacterium]|nr:YlbD family protein [Bacilli bacterium]MBR1748479.1 YlbD family protein [Bacilli bacterium]MBR1817261.1 YlbD family protein [Bacilli bacterium]